jgi:hypothetical protein
MAIGTPDPSLPVPVDSGGSLRLGQLAVAAAGFQEEKGHFSHRFSVGEPESVAMLTCAVELRQPVRLTG